MPHFTLTLAESDTLGVGICRQNELIFLPYEGPVSNWTVVELDLSGGEFADYQANDGGLRLCSPRMRQVLDTCATDRDRLSWLPARVFRGADVRDYWCLHFPEPPDVLAEATLRAGGFVVKPVFSAAAIRGHAVFTYRQSEGLALIVSETTRDALRLAACTGLETSPAPLEPAR